MSYGNGYCIAGQQPVYPSVVVSGVSTAETDAERLARLAQEVGRLTAELRNVRADLRVALGGDTRAAAKVGGRPVGVEVDGVCVTVMLIDDDPDSDPYVDSLWTGSGWAWAEWLTDEFKAAATKAALQQVAEEARA